MQNVLPARLVYNFEEIRKDKYVYSIYMCFIHCSAHLTIQNDLITLGYYISGSGTLTALTLIGSILPTAAAHLKTKSDIGS